MFENSIDCPECHGSGETFRLENCKILRGPVTIFEACATCHGKTYIDIPRDIAALNSHHVHN